MHLKKNHAHFITGRRLQVNITVAFHALTNIYQARQEYFTASLFENPERIAEGRNIAKDS